MQKLSFSTSDQKQILNISKDVETRLPESGVGVVTVFTPHTGAAITTANLDPGTDLDLLDFLQDITPQKEWRHPHNPEHAPDHLLASVIGPSVIVPYENGRFLTGDWQHIVLIELDGPRERTVFISY